MSEAVVFGIRKKNNETELAGCGFLLNANTLVTCAHVINTALGREQKACPCPDKSESIHIYHINSAEKSRFETQATLLHWQLTDSYNFLDDIAILQLTTTYHTDLNQQCVEPPIWSSIQYRAYGKSKENSGWVEGTLMGVGEHGLIQLDAASHKKFQSGYSGTAVYLKSTSATFHQLVGIALSVESKDNVVAKMIPVTRLKDFWKESWGRLMIQQQRTQTKYFEPAHLSHDDELLTAVSDNSLNRFYEILKFVKDFDDNHSLRQFDHTEPAITLCLLMCDTIEQSSHVDYIGQELSTMNLQVRKAIESSQVPDDIKRKLIIYFRQYVEIYLLIAVYDELERDHRHEKTKDQWLASLKDVDQYDYTKNLLGSPEGTIPWRQLKKQHNQMCKLLNQYILTLKNLPENYEKLIRQFNDNFERNSNELLSELRKIIQSKRDILQTEFNQVKNKVLHADDIDALIDSICRSMLPNAHEITVQREKIQSKTDAILALRPQTDKSKITLNSD